MVMKTLHVSKIETTPNDAREVPALMDKAAVNFNAIGCVDWQKDYPYAPKAAFRIAYTDSALLINYRVEEETVRAVADQDCGRVWEDSCCEFFSQVQGDTLYYNMECNCGTTLLVACGAERENRECAPREILQQVKRWSSLGSAPFGEREQEGAWQMALIIPFATFFKHQITSLQGTSLKANFYKCGDKQRRPHFLSWNAIDIEKPDFHRPDYFGTLIFD